MKRLLSALSSIPALPVLALLAVWLSVPASGDGTCATTSKRLHEKFERAADRAEASWAYDFSAEATNRKLARLVPQVGAR